MTINILDTQNSILNTFIAEIRDQQIQKDSMRFRRNIERIGEILAFEISKTLTYESQAITTPLGTKIVSVPEKDIVLCSVLRAGLPLHQGFLNYFDGAENAFISAYRHHTSETEFDIKIEYFASPNLQNKTLLLVDPMLATGRSLVNVYEGLKKHGVPKNIHVACVIGSEQGIQYLKDFLPESVTLWVATVDSKLNDKGYIVPGLGDAGDLAYGNKL